MVVSLRLILPQNILLHTKHLLDVSLINYNYVANCISLEIDGNKATAAREIDGGKEIISSDLPLVIGSQKGLVEEKDLIIPENLSKNEKKWINEYHKTVFKNLKKSMNKEEILELTKACSAI